MVLSDIYRPGFAYAKAGVHLLELASADARQADLFISADEQARDHRLLETLDQVNARFGSGTLQPGVAGLQKPRGWAMKRGNKSPAYTTRWAELATATLG
jgi:DNA polymerase V